MSNNRANNKGQDVKRLRLRLRIAHVTATFPPYKGGTGNVCRYNTLQLARLGHDVHVFTAALHGAPSIEVMDGVTIHRLRPIVQVGNAPLLLGLLGALRGFDLIHLHYPFIGGAEMVRLASLLYRTPFVVTFHNDLIGEGGRAAIFAAYQKLSALLTVRWASRLCAVSTDHYEHSALRRLLSPSRPQAVELPNGVDTEVFRPISEDEANKLRERYGIVHNAPLALFVAALDRAHHFKGLDRLLAAFAALGNTNARLLIIGDGDLRAGYEAKARELGITDQAIFAGAAAHADTAPYFAAADVVVLPSMPPESFGLALVEAMSCGAPVIASDIPGIRTVVKHGSDGLLVRHASVPALTEALRAMLTMPHEQRAAMGAAGKSKVEQRYAWPRIGVKLEGIYNDVLLARRSARATTSRKAVRRAKQRA